MSTIGLVTITATLGDAFGGLGFFIFEGARRSFPTEIYAGAIPTILLALALDRLFVRAPGAAHAVGAAPARRGGHRMSIVAETVAWLVEPGQLGGAERDPRRASRSTWGSRWPSLLIALAIALPAGLYVGHTRRGTGVAVGIANVGRAVPSLALIGLVLPITQALDPVNGFSLYPTVIAMVVLAIPPVLVNADVGIRGVDAEVVQAARGDGPHRGARSCAGSRCRSPCR